MAKKQIQTVWVLTCEYNDYDQHGAYFEAVFAEQPSLLQLAEHFADTSTGSRNVMDAVAFLEHVRQGGGRRNGEDCWYNLEQVEVK